MSTGKIVQVMGAVVDCEFPVGSLPHLMNALRIDQAADKNLGTPETHLTLEVALHLGENRVRTVAMSSTDGLMRGMKVNDTGKADFHARGQGSARPHHERDRRARG